VVTRRGVAIGLATVITSIVLLLAPTYRGSGGATLLQVNGYNGVILAIPVAISSLALFTRKLRLLAGVLMLLWVVAATFTVGLFYLPIVLCLVWPDNRLEDP
jgi:hypothetical protein